MPVQIGPLLDYHLPNTLWRYVHGDCGYNVGRCILQCIHSTPLRGNAMNDTRRKHKRSFLLLLTILFLVVYHSQPAAQKTGQFGVLMEEEGDRVLLNLSENVLNESIIQKAQVFYNRKGLKEDILIEGCLRELSAISETKEESIEQLIEHVSVWIPRLYNDNFLVNPRCIIILETKINEEERAEVRFGVAMKCTARSQVPEIINI